MSGYVVRNHRPSRPRPSRWRSSQYLVTEPAPRPIKPAPFRWSEMFVYLLIFWMVAAGITSFAAGEGVLAMLALFGAAVLVLLRRIAE